MSELRTAVESALNVLNKYVAFAELAKELEVDVRYSPKCFLAKITQQVRDQLSTAIQMLEEENNVDMFKYLDLNMRTANILKEAGIDTLEKLLDKTTMDLIRLPSCGRRTINEIKEALQNKGLSIYEGYRKDRDGGTI